MNQIQAEIFALQAGQHSPGQVRDSERRPGAAIAYCTGTLQGFNKRVVSVQPCQG